MTLFGYAPSDGRLADSPTFRAECMLLTLMGRISRQLGEPCVLVYVPHPHHASARFDDPAFLDNDVRICRDSILTWLVSDLCMALASSAMFEAAYFGIRTFTPLIPSDRVFTTEYLDRVIRPNSETPEDFVLAAHELQVCGHGSISLYRVAPEATPSHR